MYEGKSIAILGSAPSLLDYFKREQEVVIGVNGASQVLRGGDIFLSADEIAFFRSWFRVLDGVMCIVRPHSAIYSSKFYPDEEVRSKLVEKWENYMDKHLDDVFYKLDLRTLIIQNDFTHEFFYNDVQLINLSS